MKALFFPGDGVTISFENCQIIPEEQDRYHFPLDFRLDACRLMPSPYKFTVMVAPSTTFVDDLHRTSEFALVMQKVGYGYCHAKEAAQYALANNNIEAAAKLAEAARLINAAGRDLESMRPT